MERLFLSIALASFLLNCSSADQPELDSAKTCVVNLVDSSGNQSTIEGTVQLSQDCLNQYPEWNGKPYYDSTWDTYGDPAFTGSNINPCYVCNAPSVSANVGNIGCGNLAWNSGAWTAFNVPTNYFTAPSGDQVYVGSTATCNQ